MTTHAHPVGDQAHRTIEEIEALAGTIKLEIHLGTMELKEKWNELEPRVQAARRISVEAANDLLSSVRALRNALAAKRKP
ncbi:MAG: hypothetical protein ACHREM_32750 [Polyangiales bacterium]